MTARSALAGLMLAALLAGCGSSNAGGTAARHRPAHGPRGVLAHREAAFTSVLVGIPQHDQRLGRADAPVQATLFGDLECDGCRDFVLGRGFARFVASEVRTGKVSIVYRSLCTATCGGEVSAPSSHTTDDPFDVGSGDTPAASAIGSVVVDNAVASLLRSQPKLAAGLISGSPSSPGFEDQQAAAYAAGLQGHFWQFAMVFLHAQRPADTGYVTPAFLDRIARETPGLRYRRWRRDSRAARLVREVKADGQLATAEAIPDTPTVVLQGACGTRMIDDPTFAKLAAAARAVG
jgi:hypothetical protein